MDATLVHQISRNTEVTAFPKNKKEIGRTARDLGVWVEVFK